MPAEKITVPLVTLDAIEKEWDRYQSKNLSRLYGRWDVTDFQLVNWDSADILRSIDSHCCACSMASEDGISFNVRLRLKNEPDDTLVMSCRCGAKWELSMKKVEEYNVAERVPFVESVNNITSYFKQKHEKIRLEEEKRRQEQEEQKEEQLNKLDDPVYGLEA